MITTTLQNYIKVFKYNPKQKESLTTANSSKNPLIIINSSANTPTRTSGDFLVKKI